jgi:hypothetical protein
MGHRDTTGDVTYKSSLNIDVKSYSPKTTANQAIQNKYPTGSRSNFSVSETVLPTVTTTIKGTNNQTITVVEHGYSAATVDINTLNKIAGLAK